MGAWLAFIEVLVEGNPPLFFGIAESPCSAGRSPPATARGWKPVARKQGRDHQRCRRTPAPSNPLRRNRVSRPEQS